VATKSESKTDKSDAKADAKKTRSTKAKAATGAKSADSDAKAKKSAAAKKKSAAAKKKSAAAKKKSAAAKKKSAAEKKKSAADKKSAAAKKAKKATDDKADAKATKTAAKKPSGKKTAAKKTTRTAKAGDGGTKTKKSAAKPKPGSALVVVESPAKARTIGKYLGKNYVVKASVGHVKDLPKSKLGVDIDAGFEPEYVVMRDKSKVITEIKKAAKTTETVFLAPDPDREGEAIAGHIADEIRPVNTNIRRVLIHEITKKGINEALAKPLELNVAKTEAQQARRVLDRLVGYQISPLLWKKVRRGLSAGRVQSVAVRLVCEREAEIAAFVPEEYWSVEADCKAENPPPFVAKVSRLDGEKAQLKNEDDAKVVVTELEAGPATVAKVEKKQRRRRPLAPFITSKLQQDASRKLRFTAKRTMALAQRLYEGLELGEEGPVGLITYMRTDSVRLSDDAVTAARTYITDRYGEDYLPEKPVEYKNKKSAQDAHEAIRPTDTKYDPETLARLLKETGNPEAPELLKLYTLIWNRFIASQMTPAVYDQTTIDIARGRVTLRATGQILRFAGFTAVYTEKTSDDDKNETNDKDRLLPEIKEGDAIELTAIRPEQHFTQPPPRYSEASLVKELEENGIGRPSTYASILSTIVAREYVEKKEGRFHPTELGSLVNELLVESFPQLLDADFTAKMEEQLDEVEEGNAAWRTVLGDFYTPFKKDLDRAEETMRDVKREEIPTEHDCEKCGANMVIKWGRNGSFLACSAYPDCRNTKEFIKHPDGKVEILPEPKTDEVCESCGAAMKVKRGRFGQFLACSTYPDCKTTKAISIGVDCPKEGCNGFITEKRSKRGKVFYGCSNYAKTNCDFVTWDRPINESCPVCEAKFLVKRETKRGSTVRCLSCDYKKATETEDAA